MDQPTTAEERKRELIARLDASRARVQAGRDGLRKSLNPLHRARLAVRKHPARTFGLAAGAAFALSLLRRRPRNERRPVSMKGLLLRGGLKMVQPAVRVWLLKLAKERFIDHRRAKSNPFHQDTP